MSETFVLSASSVLDAVRASLICIRLLRFHLSTIPPPSRSSLLLRLSSSSRTHTYTDARTHTQTHTGVVTTMLRYSSGYKGAILFSATCGKIKRGWNWLECRRCQSRSGAAVVFVTVGAHSAFDWFNVINFSHQHRRARL